MDRPRVRIVRPPHPREQGFLIIGVVMFVLALTIIGLSLFSLSSIEAQFLGRSTLSAQAFYSATGGIERAMNVLDGTDSLESVTLDLPLENVIYARARYWNAVDAKWESTGAVPWGGVTPVEIRVIAEVQGVRRAVEAIYRAEKFTDLYSNLVTTPGIMAVLDSSNAPGAPYGDIGQRTYLAGKVVQGIDNPSGVALCNTAIPGFPAEYLYDPEIPMPDAVTFISDHQTAGAPGLVGTSVYTFHGIPIGSHRFYRGGASHPATPSEPGFDFFNDVSDVTLDVPTGRAIWLLEGGGHFGGHVSVSGIPGLSTLVIVATPGTNNDIHDEIPQLPTTGLWFEGGITSLIPIILVSNGTVAIDHYYNDASTSTLLPYLSIFAGGVYVKGPRAPYDVRLVHPPSTLQSSPLTDLEILRPLYESDLLPNASLGSGHSKFTLEPGTWREVTESNPS